MNDHLLGKELFIRFTASAFRKLPSVYVISYFPFGFEGRIWDLIVSVPDHCLPFYSTGQHANLKASSQPCKRVLGQYYLESLREHNDLVKRFAKVLCFSHTWSSHCLSLGMTIIAVNRVIRQHLQRQSVG